MKFENIHKRASHILRIVEAWQKGGDISRIERDIALEELRHLYNEVSDLEADSLKASASVPEADKTVVVATVATPVAAEATMVSPVETTSELKSEEVVDIDDDILDIDALLGITPMDSTTSAPEPEPVVEVAAEPIPVATPEPAPEPTPEPEALPMSDGKLFAEEDIPMGKRSERKIVSLYATSLAGTTAAATTTAAQATEPVAAAPSAPEVKPSVAVAEEQPKRLVDVLGGGKQVLADRAAQEEMPTTPFNRITDLRKAIGINDKFLMIKDLFGGNAELYNTTIDRLNAFDDLDDCMIYIAENFAWNPDSAGAKLLVSLIERKLG